MEGRQRVGIRLLLYAAIAAAALVFGCTQTPALHSKGKATPVRPQPVLWSLRTDTTGIHSFRNGAPPPLRYKVYAADTVTLAVLLRKAPLESVVALPESNALLPLPFSESDLEPFKIVNAPVMAPELAALFPEIQTFSGASTITTSRQLKCEWTPKGFSAQLISPEGTYFIEPLRYSPEPRYIVFKKQDLPEIPGKRFDETPTR